MKIKLHQTQWEVAKDPARFKVVCAGRRWGKSVLSRLMIMKWALNDPGLYWIVTPTYTQGQKIHFMQGFIPEISAFAKVDKDFKKVKFNRGTLSLTLPNGSVIQVMSAENPDRLVGVKLKGLVIDEIAKLRNWDWLWKEALRPTLTDYEAPAIFISTPKGYNHFWNLFQIGKDPEFNLWRSWKFNSYQNPHIPSGEIDLAKTDMTEDLFQQEYMAEFKRYTGLVFNFDRLTHVKELPDFKPVFHIRGLDKGFRNPSAMCHIGVDENDTWYQTNEIYEPGLTNPPLTRLIEQVAGGMKYELSTMDSAQAGDVKDLQDLGQDFLPVKKESGEANISYVRWKIQKFAERLKIKENGKPGFYVHPSCKNTIHEFEHYSYPEKKEDEIEKEVPIKKDDHMCDALMDLNGMYLHYYEKKTKKPWEGKVPGTYIEPFEEEHEKEHGWTQKSKDRFWN